MPTSLTVPADMVANLHGHDGGIVAIPVKDSGTVPLAVSATVRDATRAALHHPAATWVRAITPRTLHLRPGQTGTIRLLVSVPRGAHGRGVTNVIFSAGPVGHGTIKLAAAVGGTLRIVHAGAQRFISPAVPRPLPTAAAFPWLPVIGAAAFLVLAGLASLTVWRHRRGVRGLQTPPGG